MGGLREHWVNLRTASPSHLRVRLVALAGSVVFALCLVAAGGGGPTVWVGTVVLGALVVAQPAGVMPALFLVWAIAAWWAAVPGPWHWALLPAAWSLLLVHASAALAASVPPQATVPRSVLVRYAARVGVVAAAVTLVWGLAALAAAGGSGTAGVGPVPSIIGLAVLAAALLGYVRLRRRHTAPDAP
ncbi:hypothetical protein AVL62_02975 [Serinicoccus chungangensis]|uniref:Uncharacterized protein n=1 Tax=Serinicoccus chungangensis TaxID=767452 RepID=A0A0W8I654_9MICO|nr:hypothetical protein [Serinicoccus chungangensis]KUG53744.1 hypothetical protein AVL62_02975 [Serinicoccus chungangensis]